MTFASVSFQWTLAAETTANFVVEHAHLIPCGDNKINTYCMLSSMVDFDSHAAATL